MAALSLAGLVAGCGSSPPSGLKGSEPAQAGRPASAFNFVVGTQTIGGAYRFTKDSVLLETAKVILEMGSPILKFRLSGLPASEVKTLLYMPFHTYFFWYDGGQPWYDGLTDVEKERLYGEIYELTARFLTEQNNTGKTFFLGHWEGDWLLLRKSYDRNRDLEDVTIKGMIDWLNVRQKAVDDAKRAVPHQNVQVYHYTELNLVRDAMSGKRRRLVNTVLPHVDVDYVSYSSYDMQGLSQEQVNQTLDYVAAKLRSKAGIAGKRVFIGEFGVQADVVGFDRQEHERRNREIIVKYLKWGTPYVLYWQVYNNEIKDGKHRGFWLIDDKNEKWPLFYTFRRLMHDGAAYVARQQEAVGREPTPDEYRRWAISHLEQRGKAGMAEQKGPDEL